MDLVGVYRNLHRLTFPDAVTTADDIAIRRVVAIPLEPLTMLRLFLFAMALALIGCVSRQAADANDVLAPVDPIAYTGVWTPDHAANRKLAQATQKQMRQRMAKLHPSGGGKPPGGGAGPPGGMGGMGGSPGGMPPGGPSGGGPPEGMPDLDPLAMMSAVGMLRPEMDFAEPLQGDLRIVMDPDAGVELGAVDRAPVTLMFRGGARDLGDGDVRAFASRESGRLVVEINTDDGTQVTHTYQLEAQGKRLRVKTQVVSSKAPIPGGIPFERLYNRVDPAAAVAP